MRVKKSDIFEIIQEELEAVKRAMPAWLNEADTDPIEIIGSLANQHGFLDLRDPLSQMGFKVDFVTSPMAMYMLEKGGEKFAVLNKKYAEDPDLVVGDIAIGRMNVEEGKARVSEEVEDEDVFWEQDYAAGFEGKPPPSGESEAYNLGKFDKEMGSEYNPSEHPRRGHDERGMRKFTPDEDEAIRKSIIGTMEEASLSPNDIRFMLEKTWKRIEDKGARQGGGIDPHQMEASDAIAMVLDEANPKMDWVIQFKQMDPSQQENMMQNAMGQMHGSVPIDRTQGTAGKVFDPAEGLREEREEDAARAALVELGKFQAKLAVEAPELAKDLDQVIVQMQKAGLTQGYDQKGLDEAELKPEVGMQVRDVRAPADKPRVATVTSIKAGPGGVEAIVKLEDGTTETWRPKYLELVDGVNEAADLGWTPDDLMGFLEKKINAMTGEVYSGGVTAKEMAYAFGGQWQTHAAEMQKMVNQGQLVKQGNKYVRPAVSETLRDIFGFNELEEEFTPEEEETLVKAMNKEEDEVRERLRSKAMRQLEGHPQGKLPPAPDADIPQEDVERVISFLQDQRDAGVGELDLSSIMADMGMELDIVKLIMVDRLGYNIEASESDPTRGKINFDSGVDTMKEKHEPGHEESAVQQGEDVAIVSGGLAGAYGEVMELTTTSEGDPAVVVYLSKDADSRVMGAKGDEVIAKISDVEVDKGINDPNIDEYGMHYQEAATNKLREHVSRFMKVTLREEARRK
jgi:hypothetical protein